MIGRYWKNLWALGVPLALMDRLFSMAWLDIFLRPGEGVNVAELFKGSMPWRGRMGISTDKIVGGLAFLT